MQITLTPVQLTRAQLGQKQALNTGETLRAIPLNDGTWKYILSFEGVCFSVRYAKPGLDAALLALNASEEEYSADGY